MQLAISSIKMPSDTIYSPISLKEICNRILKKYMSCQNALDILIFAHVIKLRTLRDKAKEFIWANKSNDLMKLSWKNLEKTNFSFFQTALEILLEIFDYEIENYFMRLKLLNTIFFVTEDLTLEDVVIAVMEDGLMMDNAIKVLLAAGRLKAKKVVQKAGEFIWKKRECRYMKNQWKDLQNEYLMVFFCAGKILFHY